MNIGIVGNGVVGNATAKSYEGFVDKVYIYDVKPERCRDDLRTVLGADIVFVCLPTPQTEGELACDTHYVNDFLFSAFGLKTNIVIKSTVPIGFTRAAAEKYQLPNLVHSPEFLTARTAEYDACNPTRVVIGYPNVIPNSPDMLWRLYRGRWPYKDVPIYVMLSDESETVKLAQNGFSAAKIAFFNELRCICDKMGLDWDRVLSALLASGWINPMHTNVPGPDGKCGFGGACLPKDLANLITCMRDLGLTDNVSFAAHTRNKEDRLR